MRTICLLNDECHLMSPTSVSLGQNIHHAFRLRNENLLEFSFLKYSDSSLMNIKGMRDILCLGPNLSTLRPHSPLFVFLNSNTTTSSME